MTKPIESASYECLNCKEKIDFSKTDWSIGHLENMKTKTVVCKNGHTNNLSIPVKNRITKLMKVMNL